MTFLSSYEPLLGAPKDNVGVNRWPELLIPDPSDVDRVGKVLGEFHALRLLLLSSVGVMLPGGICTILGTDGAGVEHSPMARQHTLAASLVAYWARADPLLAMVNNQFFVDSAKRHLDCMSGNPVCAGHTVPLPPSLTMQTSESASTTCSRLVLFAIQVLLWRQQ